ncbi:NAD(P)H-dependent oxidoreductase subunit E [Desulfofalx alkaliphila]|uniref:NADH-quinone oxidoreductase subunit NuoE family protein n=1 Tax=Desulfofalx alkaliphila TaxID=105483 RepID=UPI00068F3AF5|nr:NAD(P)H-dependent oxidoreductase subunit E [Desulfofalx alkaliphila]
MKEKNCCNCNNDIVNVVSQQPSIEIESKPPAKHRIAVCLGTSCHLRGGSDLLQQLITELGIQPGEVTEDGIFALEVVRCLGACAVGPVLMVDKVLYPNMEPGKVPGVIKSYR